MRRACGAKFTLAGGGQSVTHSPGQTVQQSSFFRYVFWALWFVLVPTCMAFLAVTFIDGGSSNTGPLVTFVREQRVPAIIVLFTGFEMTLYYFRHHLPLAGHASSATLQGLSAELRREAESAAHLLDEADRIIARRGSEIQKALSESARQEVNEALEALREWLKAQPFNEARFAAAYERAHVMVERHLAPWRKGELREYVESIGIAILVALMLRAVVVEAFKIPSGSMLPTLQIGDHIFVNKFVYGPTIPFTNTRIFASMPPNRGDVMVFEYPDPDLRRERQDFIKRVIAIPGDVLEVDAGHPIINGWRVPSCKVGHYAYSETSDSLERGAELYVEFLQGTAYLALYEDDAPSEKEGPYHVRPGDLWVLGDNRHNSMDSRRWLNGKGAGVPFANIKGRAMFVWLPMSRLLVNVMGTPQVPGGAAPEVLAGIERCLATRPADADTVPPPARAP